jgi:hypothetical protein
LFYLITDQNCVALPSIDVRMSTPLKDKVAVVRPPDRNSDARGQARIGRSPLRQTHAAAVLIWLSPPDPAVAPITSPLH